MKYIYYIVSALWLFSACSDIERNPIDHDTVPPKQVTGVEVEPLPGGAKVTYQLPGDPDLLYIEASYTLPNGESRKVNSSYNTRSINVEGFAEVKEYKMMLTSVDRSGNRSTPYELSFTPDTPPVISVFNTVKIQADFGGVNLQWNNPNAAELALIISKKDSLGDNVYLDTYYTSSKIGTYTLRGQKLKETEFSVKLRDKWNNYSDVKSATIIPIYEAKLDRAKFSYLGLDYVDRVTDPGNTSKLWDNDRINNVFGGSNYPWHVSMGLDTKPVKLSRIVIWQYAWPDSKDYGHYYAGGNGKTFEIYGSNDPTPGMEGWTLLMVCDIVKPSGLPYGYGREYMSDEDFDLARNKGHEFNVPLDAPAVRYIRVRSIAGFESTLATPSELYFYGDPR